MGGWAILVGALLITNPLTAIATWWALQRRADEREEKRRDG